MDDQVLSVKQYLADIILPDITEAIVEIVKERPENPIQFMIQFLEQKIN